MNLNIQTINDLNNEIINHVYELDEIQMILKEFIHSNELTPENQIYLSEIGDRHIKLCNKIKVLLECYFNEEKEAQLPKVLSYHRLYKQLCKV